MRLFIFLYLFISVFITQAYAIYGGKDATFETHPWHVSLNLQKGICGGAIIHPRAILTAAHCVR